ncbi:KREMEN2 [Branchiostoma lanceolatum]|uniref:KREMEN2 protein n=1 Tax=Branchiostoma lanceolatum TaxID=7740 RepID=A0A8K0EE37_BRALA|nr:KREMEN2 [Branchiostoma lanceolatum]
MAIQALCWSLYALLLLRTCEGVLELRLVDGRNPFEGRLEVRDKDIIGRQWGTVCDDRWGIKDAEVACRQLGFPGAMWAHGGGRFPHGAGRIWLSELRCDGSEANLGECAHGGWETNFCDHSQDAGVICHVPGYLGCYRDFLLPDDRVFYHEYLRTFAMTIQMCTEHCRGLGYKYAGTQRGTECFCGQDEHFARLGNRRKDRECQDQCAGDPDQICGSGYLENSNRLTLYDATMGACGGNLTETDAFIYSPGFPGNYTKHVTCTWTITVPEYHVIDLDFTMLQLSDGDVIAMEDPAAGFRTTFTGDVIPEVGVTCAETLHISFRSASSKTGRGFVMTYQALNRTTVYNESADWREACWPPKDDLLIEPHSHQDFHTNWVLIIGIAVGAGVAVLVLCVMLLAIVLTKRKQQNNRQQVVEMPDVVFENKNTALGLEARTRTRPFAHSTENVYEIPTPSPNAFYESPSSDDGSGTPPGGNEYESSLDFLQGLRESWPPPPPAHEMP